MAHVVAPNLRGKGISKTKFTKTGEPKRSGNWSVAAIHYQSLQSKDYHVRYWTLESGVQILVVGDNKTPLEDIMGKQIANLAMFDKHFEQYTQSGYKEVGTELGTRKYEVFRYLKKNRVRSSSYGKEDVEFTYREAIYTENDFNYTFPEY